VQQSAQPATDIGLPGSLDIDIFKAGSAETDISAIWVQPVAASVVAIATVAGISDASSRSKMAKIRMHR
jgi:hypothetical protein